MATVHHAYSDHVKNDAAALLAELNDDPKPNFLWYSNRAHMLARSVQAQTPDAHAQAPVGWKHDSEIVQDTIAAINAKMEVAYNLPVKHP